MKSVPVKTISLSSVLILGLSASVWTACTKEEIRNEPAIEETMPGVPKVTYIFTGFTGSSQTAPFSFYVQRGNIPYGTLIKGTGSLNYQSIVSQTTSVLNIEGSSEYPVCGGSMQSVCVLEKGANSPWYYIVPNQNTSGTTTKALKLRLRGNPTVPTTCQYFKYDAALNQWYYPTSGACDPNLYFEFSFVTAVPPAYSC